MRLRSVLFWLLLLALLVPAATLTIARFVEPPGRFWVEAVAFTPVAIPLYAAACGLLLVRVVFPGRGLRILWLLGALALVVPLALHGWWFSPQLVGINPDPAEGARPLTVVSANSKKGEIDALALLEAATKADADVLVVQEITPQELTRLESGGLDEAFGHRAGEAKDGVQGTMVFSRFPLRHPQRVDTSLGSWSMELAAPDGPLRLVAVHSTNPTDLARWRRDQAAIRAAAEDADLVVGDFNASPDNSSMRILAARGLRSAAELSNQGWQPTWPADDSRRFLGVPVPTLTQIDHVLVGDQLAALSTRTLEIPGTDHRVVVAQVAAR